MIGFVCMETNVASEHFLIVVNVSAFLECVNRQVTREIAFKKLRVALAFAENLSTNQPSSKIQNRQPPFCSKENTKHNN